MLHDAEKYKDDEEQKGRIDAKHHLESYANSVKNSVKDDKIATNIDSGEKQGDVFLSSLQFTLTALHSSRKPAMKRLNGWITTNRPQRRR